MAEGAKKEWAWGRSPSAIHAVAVIGLLISGAVAIFLGVVTVPASLAG